MPTHFTRIRIHIINTAGRGRRNDDDVWPKWEQRQKWVECARKWLNLIMKNERQSERNIFIVHFIFVQIHLVSIWIRCRCSLPRDSAAHVRKYDFSIASRSLSRSLSPVLALENSFRLFSLWWAALDIGCTVHINFIYTARAKKKSIFPHLRRFSPSRFMCLLDVGGDDDDGGLDSPVSFSEHIVVHLTHGCVRDYVLFYFSLRIGYGMGYTFSLYIWMFSMRSIIIKIESCHVL